MRIALQRQIHKSTLILAYCKFGLKEEHMCAMYCDTVTLIMDLYRAMNSVDVFAEDITPSVTGHFGPLIAIMEPHTRLAYTMTCNNQLQNHWHAVLKLDRYVLKTCLFATRSRANVTILTRDRTTTGLSFNL